MYNPLISVIVPVYNREKTLDVCIKGILASKYENIELVLVDDGSMDKSLEVCKHYAERDARVKVVSQKNQGVSAARNTGIRHSKGEWVSFIDSDDTVLSSYYDNLVRNGDLEHVDMTLVDRCPGMIKDGEAVQRFPQGKTYTKKVEGRAEIVKFLFGEFNPYIKNFYNSINKFFRRKTLIDNDLWFVENITLGEDQIFVLDYLRYANSLYYDSTAYYLHFNWSKEDRTYGLGHNLRTPDYYLKIQEANYDAFERLYSLCPDMGMKEYEVNYILDRPVSKVLYGYTLFKNIRKFGYSQLRDFTKERILPLLQKEKENAEMLHDGLLNYYIRALFAQPFMLVYLQLVITSNAENCYKTLVGNAKSIARKILKKG